MVAAGPAGTGRAGFIVERTLRSGAQHGNSQCAGAGGRTGLAAPDAGPGLTSELFLNKRNQELDADYTAGSIEKTT